MTREILERFDGTAEPLADLLLARGVPFAFLTGYRRVSIDRRYSLVPLPQKPVDAGALEQVPVAVTETNRWLDAADGDCRRTLPATDPG